MPEKADAKRSIWPGDLPRSCLFLLPGLLPRAAEAGPQGGQGVRRRPRASTCGCSINAQVPRNDETLREAAAADPRIELMLEDEPEAAHRARFAACDVCLAPSRWEGLGLPLYEATAFGLPIVTNDKPPMSEMVLDGRSGILVASEPTATARSGIPAWDPDVAALTAAIERLGDRAELERMRAGVAELAGRAGLVADDRRPRRAGRGLTAADRGGYPPGSRWPKAETTGSRAGRRGARRRRQAEPLGAVPAAGRARRPELPRRRLLGGRPLRRGRAPRRRRRWSASTSAPATELRRQRRSLRLRVPADGRLRRALAGARDASTSSSARACSTASPTRCRCCSGCAPRHRRAARHRDRLDDAGRRRADDAVPGRRRGTATRRTGGSRTALPRADARPRRASRGSRRSGRRAPRGALDPGLHARGPARRSTASACCPASRGR